MICSMVGKGCHNVMADSAEHYNGSSGSFRKERDIIMIILNVFNTLFYCILTIICFPCIRLSDSTQYAVILTLEIL